MNALDWWKHDKRINTHFDCENPMCKYGNQFKNVCNFNIILTIDTIIQ